MNKLFIFIPLLFTGCWHPPYIGETEKEYHSKNKWGIKLYLQTGDSTTYRKSKTSDNLHYSVTYYVFKKGVCTEIIKTNEVRVTYY